MNLSRTEIVALASDLDRLTRLLHVSTRPGAKEVDIAGIGPFGAMILLTISDHEPLPIMDLAKLLARDKAQMTRAVQLLERNALVERKGSEADGRVSLVSLTNAGRDLAENFRDLLADVVAAEFAEIDADDVRRFAATLNAVLSNEKPSG